MIIEVSNAWLAIGLSEEPRQQSNVHPSPPGGTPELIKLESAEYLHLKILENLEKQAPNQNNNINNTINNIKYAYILHFIINRGHLQQGLLRLIS